MNDEDRWDGEGWELKDAAGTNVPVTVGGLMLWLAVLPPEAKVILSRDAEGNGYKPLLMVSKHRASIDVATGYADVEIDPVEDGEFAGEKVVVLWPYD